MSDRTFLLQDWVTVRSGIVAANPTALAQSQEGWLDLTGFADATYWIDVTEITPPSAGASLQLLLETAPTCDDIVNTSAPAQSWFQPTTGPILLGTAAPFILASATPVAVNSVRSASTVSLSRYLRWRIVPSTSGAWDVTFRIRVVANRSGFFVPTDIGGCVLWLRADLGLSFNGANVSGWNDQSGTGDSNRNLAQSNSTLQPAYTLADPNYNGRPSLNSGTGRYLVSGTWSTSYAQPTTAYFCGLLSSGGRLFDGNIPTGVRQLVQDWTPGDYGIFAGNTVITSSQVSGVRGVGCATYQGASSAFYFSSSTTNILSAGNPGASNINTLGIFATQDGQGPSNGTELAELIIFSSAHTLAQRRRVFQYLGARYGQNVT